MARDRQRSKARQRARQAQEQRGGRRPRRSDAPENVPETPDTGLEATPDTGLEATPDSGLEATPDTGLDDATIEDSGLLEHISGEADIARATEAGAELPDGEFDGSPFADEERADRAPDEMELPPDLRPTRRGRRLAEPELAAGPPAEHKERTRVGAFIRGCIEELGRVQWPDRPQVFQATAVVLGFVLVAGSFLGLMDAIWKPLINAIL